jgi:REP element-mobilizing transposase RayT
MTRTRYRIFEATQPHFLTCTVVDWLPVFSRPEAAQVVLDSWQFLQTTNRLTLYAYVILENHLHFVAAAADLPKEVKDFKSFTARKVIDFFHDRGDHEMLDRLERLKLPHKSQSRHQLWQEGSHPQQVMDDAMMVQKVEYIHNNPVKRGYVDDPVHWRYSSARNYAGLPGVIDVTTQWE